MTSPEIKKHERWRASMTEKFFEYSRGAFMRPDLTFPSADLRRRTALALADLVTRVHSGTDTPTADDIAADFKAHADLQLLIRKCDWARGQDRDPEGLDEPWGPRATPNDYPNRYSVKSFEWYVTADAFGVTGYDKHGDQAYNVLRTNNPAETPVYREHVALPPVSTTSPDALTPNEMAVIAEQLAWDIADLYELPHERVTRHPESLGDVPAPSSRPPGPAM